MNKLKLKTLSLKELQTRELKVQKDLSELRYDVRIGQEKDFSGISKKRKELAKIKTLIKEIDLGLHAPLEKTIEKEEKPKKEEKKDNKKSEKREEDKEVKVKSKTEKKNK